MENGETMEDILLAELVTEEIRAKRSLRALEHQETRITKLENDVSGSTALMLDLEENHVGLLEVHKCQTEVQNLQKQLIKLQEIQYLTEFTKVWNEQCSKHGLNDQTQEDAHHLVSSQVPSKVAEKQSCSSSFSDPVEKPLTREEKVGSEVALSGSLSSLVTLLEFIKRPSVTPSQDPDESKIDVLSRFGMKSQPKLNKQSQPLSFEEDTCDDDCEKITMLRDTLNLHRKSIESLSSEVTYLRDERAELVTYLNSLLEWKKNVEGESSSTSPKYFASNKEEKTEMGLKPVGSPFRKNPIRTRKQVRLTLHGSETNGMEKGELEERAYKLWTTSRKFFTPDQTNYILTAPYPPEELESESGVSAEEF